MGGRGSGGFGRIVGQCCGGGLGVGGHDRQLATGLNRAALFGQQFGHDTGSGGRNLDGYLVGLQFAQHLIGFERLTGFFEPGGDCRLGHAFAQGGDHDVDLIATACAVVFAGLHVLGTGVDGLGGLFGRVVGGFAAFADLCQQGVNAHSVAFASDDFGQRAGGGGRNLNRDFVGFKFTQHFVLRDSIAGLFEPSGDGGFGDAFTKGGDADFGHYFDPSMVSASSTSAVCCALCCEARPVAGDAAAARPA